MAELSARYATALFGLSLERNLLDEYLEQAAFLRDALQDDECRGVIGAPNIPAADKRNFINAVFGGKIHDDLLGLLHLAVAKNRESFLAPALTGFLEMGVSHKGNTTALVISATEMSESQILTLKKLLSKKLNKNVEISARVDQSVIGGFYVHVDGYCLDGTVKRHLKDMKASIKRSAPDDFKT